MKLATNKALVVLTSALILVAVAARAATFNITFDPGDPIGGLPAGSTLSNQYFATTGATFTPNGFTGSGGPTGSWATNTNMTVVSSTGADVGGLGSPSLVSGNILRSFNGWLGENGDPSFRITFATAINFISATFAGIAVPASTRIFAFNGTTLVATATASATGQQVLSLAGLFTSVVITPGDFNDWVGVDNITFTTAPTQGTVPDAGDTLMLMGLAAAAMLFAARRRLAAQ